MHRGLSLDEFNVVQHISYKPKPKLFILVGNINCHWVEVQLGILSFQADNTFPWISVFLGGKIFFLDGQKTQLNSGLQGLDLGNPQYNIVDFSH